VRHEGGAREAIAAALGERAEEIIAAILCARITLLDDVAGDPIGSTVDIFERVLAELRARGHGNPDKS
jgi:hypothetical protein